MPGSEDVDIALIGRHCAIRDGSMVLNIPAAIVRDAVRRGELVIRRNADGRAINFQRDALAWWKRRQAKQSKSPNQE